MKLAGVLASVMLVVGCAPFDEAHEDESESESEAAAAAAAMKAGGTRASSELAADDENASGSGTFSCGDRRCRKSDQYCLEGLADICMPLPSRASCEVVEGLCSLLRASECSGDRSVGMRVACR